jgi:hypothetical protein
MYLWALATIDRVPGDRFMRLCVCVCVSVCVNNI